jgi:hypothetical protein
MKNELIEKNIPRRCIKHLSKYHKLVKMIQVAEGVSEAQRMITGRLFFGNSQENNIKLHILRRV